MSDLVLTEINDGYATVTMNRPKARNALTLPLIEALGEAIDLIELNQRDVGAVILRGSGKAYCAGMDLKAVMSDPPGMREMLVAFGRVLGRIRALPMPTIACVQGAAIGGGCGLMVVTDFSITHPEAKVGYPEVSLGLCPAVVAPWLIRRIGPGRARAMLLAGRTISGSEALDEGLATHLVERDRLETEARELAVRLADGSRPALATTKRWLNELEGQTGLLEKGALLSAEVLAGDEAQARLRAHYRAD